MKLRNRTSGVEYRPSTYSGGKLRIMIEVSSEEDFRMFAKIAHSARLTKIGETTKNMVDLDGLDFV